MEAGEEEPKSTDTVKLQGWKLVLPTDHQLDSSYQCNAIKWNRTVGGLFGVPPPPPQISFRKSIIKNVKNLSDPLQVSLFTSLM